MKEKYTKDIIYLKESLFNESDIKPLEYYVNEIEELSLFTYCSKRRTQLPVDLFIDTSKIYEYFEHPLWLYFQNSYNSTDDLWLPIYVANQPELVYKNEIVNISNNDLNKIILFIKKFKKSLINVADEKKKYIDFFKELKNYYFNETINLTSYIFGNNINEMANLDPDETGIPVKIWVDEKQSYKLGGHTYRLKFAWPKEEKNSHNFVTMRFHDKEIEPEKYRNQIPGKLKKKISNFIDANEQLLKDLADKKIEVEDFQMQVWPLDAKGYPQPPWVVGNLIDMNKTNYGYRLVKNKNNKYNFYTPDNILLSKIWFDGAEPFTKDIITGKLYALVELNDQIQKITSSGKLIDF